MQTKNYLSKKYLQYFLYPILAAYIATSLVNIYFPYYHLKQDSNKIDVTNSISKITFDEVKSKMDLALTFIQGKLNQGIEILLMFDNYVKYTKMLLDKSSVDDHLSLIRQQTINVYEIQKDKPGTAADKLVWIVASIDSQVQGDFEKWKTNTNLVDDLAFTSYMSVLIRSVFVDGKPRMFSTIYVAFENSGLFSIYGLDNTELLKNEMKFSSNCQMSNDKYNFKCRNWYWEVSREYSSNEETQIVLLPIYRSADDKSWIYTMCSRFTFERIPKLTDFMYLCLDIKLENFFSVLEFKNASLYGYYFVFQKNSNIPIYYPNIFSGFNSGGIVHQFFDKNQNFEIEVVTQFEAFIDKLYGYFDKDNYSEIHGDENGFIRLNKTASFEYNTLSKIIKLPLNKKLNEIPMIQIAFLFKDNYMDDTFEQIFNHLFSKVGISIILYIFFGLILMIMCVHYLYGLHNTLVNPMKYLNKIMKQKNLEDSTADPNRKISKESQLEDDGNEEENVNLRSFNHISDDIKLLFDIILKLNQAFNLNSKQEDFSEVDGVPKSCALKMLSISESLIINEIYRELNYDKLINNSESNLGRLLMQKKKWNKAIFHLCKSIMNLKVNDKLFLEISLKSSLIEFKNNDNSDLVILNKTDKFRKMKKNDNIDYLSNTTRTFNFLRNLSQKDIRYSTNMNEDTIKSKNIILNSRLKKFKKKKKSLKAKRGPKVLTNQSIKDHEVSEIISALEHRFPKLLICYYSFWSNFKKLKRTYDKLKSTNNLGGNISLLNYFRDELLQMEDHLLTEDHHSLLTYEYVCRKYIKLSKIYLEYIKDNFPRNNELKITWTKNAARSYLEYNQFLIEFCLDDTFKDEGSSVHMDNLPEWTANYSLLLENITTNFNHFEILIESLISNRKKIEKDDEIFYAYLTLSSKNQLNSSMLTSILVQKYNFLKAKMFFLCNDYENSIIFFIEAQRNMNVIDARMVKESNEFLLKIYSNLSEQLNQMKARSEMLKTKVDPDLEKCIKVLDNYQKNQYAILNSFTNQTKDVVMIIDNDSVENKNEIDQLKRYVKHVYNNLVYPNLDKFAIHIYNSENILKIIGLTAKNLATNVFVNEIISKIDNYISIDDAEAKDAQKSDRRFNSQDSTILKEGCLKVPFFQKLLLIKLSLYKDLYSVSMNNEILEPQQSKMKVFVVFVSSFTSFDLEYMKTDRLSVDFKDIYLIIVHTKLRDRYLKENSLQKEVYDLIKLKLTFNNSKIISVVDFFNIEHTFNYNGNLFEPHYIKEEVVNDLLI